MNLHLKEISRAIAPGAHAVLLLDRAGWHIAHEVEAPKNITLMLLPSKSPELNPVENLWHYFRSHYWSNRTYANYDALRLAAIDAWQKAALDPTMIQSVCRASYAERID